MPAISNPHPCLFIERDYYDIVSARLYGELLAWFRYRVKSEYCLMGQVDGYPSASSMGGWRMKKSA
ncbi:MAG: hypothetical protein U0559_01485 [Anaerolineae bacterium]